MKKAFRMDEIDSAVNKFQPVTPDHPFYVNFENLRGDFQEKNLASILNVERQNGHYIYNYKVNQGNKTLLFLAGMRGSGKTSELAKFAQLLHLPQCFFVVTCNVDQELDMDNVQYMDILIFQLEMLLKRAADVGLNLDDDILESMQLWFQERVIEINRSLKADGSAELELEPDKSFNVAGLLGKLIGLTVKLTTGLSGSYERANTIRIKFQNRFIDFSQKFNTFIEQVNAQLRKEGKGQEVLYIVDGLEKTMGAETRRKIIMEESNRIRQIRVNTIFTLPIELMKERQHIRNFSEIVTFPSVKIKERDGTLVKEAVARFEDMVLKRVSEELFDSHETIRLAVEYSGGSPRQLLDIIQRAKWQADNEVGKITRQDMEKSIEKLGNELSLYLEHSDFELLKALKNDLDAGNPIGFDGAIQNLLEQGILFEYNDGTYKQVNPALELSKLYKHHVIGKA